MNKIIVFGASGDLAKRMLIPALSKIHKKGLRIIGYARSDLKRIYAQELRKFFKYETDFPECVEYIKGSYDDLSPLKDIIDSNSILYFSVPPHIHIEILLNLKNFDYGAIGVEKPFGHDFESFLSLKDLNNDRVHFIDHYLLKPLMISVNEILQNNTTLFELLSNRDISRIDCYFVESIHAEGRAYYDKSGMTKDVVQNHLIEVLVTILCRKHNHRSLEEHKIDFIKDMKIDQEKIVFGQYETYQDELGSKSNTETFTLLKCDSDNEKWKGIPILMIAGKAMSRKATEIIFVTKPSAFERFLDMAKNRTDNLPSKTDVKRMDLVFVVSPTSEIYLRIFTSHGDHKVVLYDCDTIEKAKEAKFGDYWDYEIIFNCLINKSDFPSVCYNEALALWKLFDRVHTIKKDLIYYKNGAEIPDEAKEVLEEFNYAGED